MFRFAITNNLINFQSDKGEYVEAMFTYNEFFCLLHLWYNRISCLGRRCNKDCEILDLEMQRTIIQLWGLKTLGTVV